MRGPSGAHDLFSEASDAIRAISCLLWVTACTAPLEHPPSAQPLPPAAAHLAGHLSPLDQQHLAVIRGIHEGRGIIQRARESGILVDSVEWWVPGPPEVLPFAGTWRGIAGIAEFERRQDSTMRYDRVELRRYLVSGEDVAAVFLGTGVAKATGRPFESEIVRLYTVHDGKMCACATITTPRPTSPPSVAISLRVAGRLTSACS